MAKIDSLENLTGAELSAELQRGGKDVTAQVVAMMKRAAQAKA